MHYQIEAQMIDQASGKPTPAVGVLTSIAGTKMQATESAASLRARGFTVRIIGHDGKTLDEASTG